MNDDHIIQITAVFHLLGDLSRLRITFACLDGLRNVGEIDEAAGGSVADQSSFSVAARRTHGLYRAPRSAGYSAADDHLCSIINDIVHEVVEPHDDV